MASYRQLLREQIISPDDKCFCILTDHELKDPDATRLNGPKAHHKPAQGRARNERRPGLPMPYDLQALKGRDRVARRTIDPILSRDPRFGISQFYRLHVADEAAPQLRR